MVNDSASLHRLIKRYAKNSRIWRIINPIVTKSKGMLKTTEFDASYIPIVTKSKGMQKTPEFDASLTL